MKLLQTKDYLFFIDEKAEIEVNDWYHHTKYNHICQCKAEPNMNMVEAGCIKIIAYYPLTKEAEELDLPLLPPFEDYSLDKAKEFAIDKFKGTFTKYPRGGKISNEGIQEIIKVSVETGYKFSTKAAQSKQFSLEDMINAFNMGQSTYKESFLHKNGEERRRETKERFIQSLSTQQLPKEFIPEYEDVFNKTDSCSILDNNYHTHSKKLKTISNQEGKEFLVGTYKY